MIHLPLVRNVRFVAHIFVFIVGFKFFLTFCFLNIKNGVMVQDGDYLNGHLLKGRII